MIKVKLKRSQKLQEEKIRLLQKFKQELDKYKEYFWVFFDTETTGKKTATEQITEFAAIAVDANFSQTDQPAIYDSLHKKIFLRTGMEITTSKENPMDMSRAEIASMTRSGAPRNPKKAMRKGVQPFKKENFAEEKELCVLLDNFLKNLENTKKVVLVAHNARFDISFVKDAFKRNGLGDFKYPVIDTVKLARDFYVPLLRAGKEKELVSIYDKLFNQTEIDLIMKGDLSKRLAVLAGVLEIDATGWHSAIKDVQMLINVTKAMVSQIEKYGSAYDLEDKIKPRYNYGTR